MTKSYSHWTGSFVAILTAGLSLGLLSTANAKQYAHGRVTELNGIPYYVGEAAISQIMGVPASTYGTLSLEDVDLFPLTVMSSNKSRFTGHQLDSIVSDYMDRDDVFNSAFLDGQSCIISLVHQNFAKYDFTQ